jgi:Transposase DDE domain group 1
MAMARMMMIAAGYEDCDDIDALKRDPTLKMAVGRAPESSADLMSQPTLSRLENLPDWRALARIGLGQIDLYCRSFARPPSRIVLDIDDTDDPAHGQQELALFNAHYDCTCFQPIHIFDGTCGKPVLSLLRPGKRPSGLEVSKILRHVICRIRKHWPKVAVLVRADCQYCSESALVQLEAMHCDYIIGFAINSRLLEIAAPWRAQCEVRRSKHKPVVRRFHQLPYRGREWSQQRKLIARVEATGLGTDARFIVTSLAGRSKTLYEKVFCARGAAENLIKDMKRFHTIRQDRLLALAGQPVPALPARGCLLVAALSAPRGTQALTLARGHFRDHPAHLCENRRPCRRAEGQDQARLPSQLS